MSSVATEARTTIQHLFLTAGTSAFNSTQNASFVKLLRTYYSVRPTRSRDSSFFPALRSLAYYSTSTCSNLSLSVVWPLLEKFAKPLEIRHLTELCLEQPSLVSIVPGCIPLWKCVLYVRRVTKSRMLKQRFFEPTCPFLEFDAFSCYKIYRKRNKITGHGSTVFMFSEHSGPHYGKEFPALREFFGGTSPSGVEACGVQLPRYFSQTPLPTLVVGILVGLQPPRSELGILSTIIHQVCVNSPSEIIHIHRAPN